VAAAFLLMLALAATACGPTAVETPTPTATASPAAPTSPSASTSATPPASASAVPSGSVRVDLGLLDLLPADVAGHPFMPDPESAAEAASDPALAAARAEALAMAIAADPSTDSFVVASVARLRPGPFDEELFRDWRDSFDEGACRQADGVTGNAQAEIGGRTVYIGTCAGGSHTYHVFLDDENAIISLNVIGDATFGQQVLETLPD
jgi:hypothetical protein